ncbi:MAG: preprotein translocase subunit SecA [Deltaproteobacteria bacterium]|nr:preprotein translocase subunit SecA [Deltaproteobacteria bacterium]
MFKQALYKVFGTKNDRELKKLVPFVARINELEPQIAALADMQLQAKTAEFKTRLANGESLDALLPEAFAVTRESSKRVLGMRHFDVQLIGGMVLHGGKIAEMKTGEGKTLVATLPAYLNALEGKGVHVVTVNDYLARRDAEWMGRLYRFLGLDVGCIVVGLSQEERQRNYAADITYGQNNEFGFDYLRDNMKVELSETAQRSHHFAIVDEVDSILVDEARTPLIISGPSEEATDKYKIADQVVRHLRENEHFTIDLKGKNAILGDEGVKFVEELLKVENLYDPRNIQLVHHINNSLKAHGAMKRDVDYVVRNGQVVIVDEFTGRLMPGRRWSDGLHQAVEAKEGVQVQRENQTLATITFQNYFRMYKKLSGMTGTADTEALEFKKIYNLEVMVIPTNRGMVRKDSADVVFVSENAKFKAVCDEIAELVEKGQPVLVGTASIAKSEMLSEQLKQRGVPHHVLNAKQHEHEAEIVAQAGRYKAVTISTNMAGRGTDIVLGGNPEFMAANAAGTRDPSDPQFQEELERAKRACAEEREQVLAAGGLHILGTERHESRRIDNQLRGRAGRQGDPGSSRFYISLEDDLMKRFGGERMKAMMSRLGAKEDDAIEGRIVSSSIERAQKKVEAYHFDIRKHLLEYDDVLNKHREIVYSLRDRVIRAEEMEEQFLEVVGDVVEHTVLSRVSEKEPPSTWDIEGIYKEFNEQFGMSSSAADVIARAENASSGLAQELYDNLLESAKSRYHERQGKFGPEIMLKLSRVLFLEAIDYFWKEHLTNIDYLKEGIGLRGYGQKNPLLEYQKEAFELFSLMMLNVKSNLVQRMFTFQLVTQEEVAAMEERERELQAKREAAAHTIHQDASAAPLPPTEAPLPPKPEPAPQIPTGDQLATERARKEVQRKKNKAQKEARKRAR